MPTGQSFNVQLKGTMTSDKTYDLKTSFVKYAISTPHRFLLFFINVNTGKVRFEDIKDYIDRNDFHDKVNNQKTISVSFHSDHIIDSNDPKDIVSKVETINLYAFKPIRRLQLLEFHALYNSIKMQLSLLPSYRNNDYILDCLENIGKLKYLLEYNHCQLSLKSVNDIYEAVQNNCFDPLSGELDQDEYCTGKQCICGKFNRFERAYHNFSLLGEVLFTDRDSASFHYKSTGDPDYF